MWNPRRRCEGGSFSDERGSMTLLLLFLVAPRAALFAPAVGQLVGAYPPFSPTELALLLLAHTPPMVERKRVMSPNGCAARTGESKPTMHPRCQQRPHRARNP